MSDAFDLELRERLFTHSVGGVWRVPLGQRHLAVPCGGGHRDGRIVCADSCDIARARDALWAILRRDPEAPETGVHDPAALFAALDGHATLLARLRADEGFAGDALDRLPPADLPAGDPWVLLSAAALPASRLVALLVAGARDGLIWKPAPRAAASAHLVMEALGPAAGGRLAMVQGDHTTGAILARAGRLIWAGEGPPPPGLPAPALSVPAPARP